MASPQAWGDPTDEADFHINYPGRACAALREKLAGWSVACTKSPLTLLAVISF